MQPFPDDNPTAGRNLRRGPVASVWLTAQRSLLLIAALLIAGPLAHADIDITIIGVEGSMQRNVLAFLSFERYRTRNDLDEQLIERLQERALREAVDALRPFGYYEAQATVKVEQLEASRWRVRIVIDRGRPVQLSSVQVSVEGEGREHPAFRDILTQLPLRVGDRLDHTTYDEVRDSLRRAALAYGFVEANFTTNELRVDPATYSASITLTLQTGPRYNFGTIRLDQQAINETLLRRYLRFEEAMPYDANQLLRSQFALDDSLYFSSVEVLAGEPDASLRSIPVDVKAETNRRNRYSVGLGYATDSKARGTLTWENRRLNAAGHRLRSELKAAQVQQSVEAIYLIPIGDPALEKLGFEWRYARDELGDLDTRTTRFQPSITQVGDTWQRVSFLALNRVRTITTNAIRRVESEKSTSLVIPGVSLASIPRGYLGEALFSRALFAELRGSAPALGADDSFVQLRLELERVFDLGPRWHAFLRGQIGATWVSQTASLPGTERFFAGGDRSVRGFGFSDLSPLDESGAKVGGRHLLTGTAELIRDLPRNLAIAAFVDVGNAFDRFSDPLQWSAGIGVRVRLPVVTLGFDIAQPLTNPACRSATPDPRCRSVPGFSDPPGPRLHFNFSPKL